MRTLNYILLAVADPAASQQFYSGLLGIEPVESAPTFVLYVLPNGMKLGLWSKDEMKPAPLVAGGVEVTFSEDDDSAVRATYEEWKSKAKVLQEPVAMDFGFTFVVEDPDGHRIRVFARAADPR
jgi:catechol 2,3-dioxygenase-like lactoylglutathione lyase family enzyme